MRAKIQGNRSRDWFEYSLNPSSALGFLDEKDDDAELYCLFSVLLLLIFTKDEVDSWIEWFPNQSPFHLGLIMVTAVIFVKALASLNGKNDVTNSNKGKQILVQSWVIKSIFSVQFWHCMQSIVRKSYKYYTVYR